MADETIRIKDLFPDEFLAKAVADTLEVSASAKIEKSRLTSITTLGYYSGDNFTQYHPKNREKIRNLEGLQYLENLESFDLDGSIIQDFSPISHLKNLESLALRSMNVDLAKLPNLPKLWALDLSESETKNLKELSRFSLSKLKLDRKSDLTSLPFLENLRELTICNSKNFYLTYGEVVGSRRMPMSNVKKINAFSMNLDKIDNYSFIMNLPNLSYLEFWVTKVENKNE